MADTLHKINFFLACIILFMTGCMPEKLPSTEKDRFFDVQELMNEQALLLDSLKPSLHKIAHLGDKSDNTVFTPDSADWRREFDIFLELNIDKPVLWDMYEEEEFYDSAASAEVLRYKLNDPKAKGVTCLDIYRRGGQLVMVKGEYREQSLLYVASRKLLIDFSTSNGPRLSNYSVEGWQKIIFQDTSFYEIKAEVLY